jgi:DNA-directed RNA polymerase specialized sigma24 family protein
LLKSVGLFALWKLGLDVTECGSISAWIEHLKAGDTQAAQPLWEHFCRRMIGLARKKLAEMPRRAIDEEDVVQSAFLSFCQRAEQGQFPNLANRDALWALLAVITARKAVNQVVHQGRAKRGGNRVASERAFAALDSEPSLSEIIGREPTPEFEALMIDQVERAKDLLEDPALRAIAIGKLEGRTNAEIAQQLQCSLSAVERKLRLIRHRLEAEFLTPPE